MAKRKQKTIGTKFRPSNADRYLNCLGSVVAAQDLPVDDGTVYSETGNVAHALSEKCIETDKNARDFLGEKLCTDRGIEVAVDSDMTGGVQMYVDWIRNQGFTELELEKQVTLDWIKNRGGEVTTGYADLVGYSADFDTLIVADYKNGVMPVANESYQFACYAYPLICDKDSKYSHLSSVMTVKFQPNVMYGSHIGSHIWTKSDLIRLKAKIMYAVNWVNKTKQEKLTDKDFCKGDWCKFCPVSKQAPERCPAKINEMFEVVKPEDTLPVPSTLTPERIKLILERRGDIKKWLDDVYKHQLSEALKGNVLEGMKIVDGRSKARAWRKNLTEAQVVETLVQDAGLLRDECFQPLKVISPATVKKLLKGKLDPIEELLVPAEKSVELTHESDKRLSKDGSDYFPA